MEVQTPDSPSQFICPACGGEMVEIEGGEYHQCASCSDRFPTAFDAAGLMSYIRERFELEDNDLLLSMRSELTDHDLGKRIDEVLRFNIPSGTQFSGPRHRLETSTSEKEPFPESVTRPMVPQRFEELRAKEPQLQEHVSMEPLAPRPPPLEREGHGGPGPDLPVMKASEDTFKRGNEKKRDED